MTENRNCRLAVDIGGTFTDTVLVDASNRILATAKTATTQAKPSLGALSGVRSVLQKAGLGFADISGFIHGTTLATNALIERRGARVATITNAGFRDILEIAYERRYSQYDINLVKPDLIVPRARSFTIGGRMTAQGAELEPLDPARLPGLIESLRETSVEAVAICLLHAYANPAHEQALNAALKASLPELVISLSHEVSPEAREFDRLSTTVANAYIQPGMADYLADFEALFHAEGLGCPILMMTASGGMTTMETARRLPIRLVESGPAGGAILASRIARQVAAQKVLSFDMGGTTAKLCLIDGYRAQKARKFEIARAARFIRGSGMPVRIPVIEMIEIGAGGGSIAHVDRLGRLQIGPQSAGAEPGPAAFAKGGENATVTDADVVQGLIDPERFAEGRLAIDADLANAALARDVGDPLDLLPEEAARSVSEIVDENMAAASRLHAVESGKELETRVMIAFGGNGPLHATRVARRAGLQNILIPASPGVGSAVGFLFAPISFEIVRSHYTRLAGLDVGGLNDFLAALRDEAERVVRLGAPGGALTTMCSAFMRYQGQGHEIEIPLPQRPLVAADVSGLRAAFEEEYSRQFSRAVPGMEIEILNWALEATAPSMEMKDRGGLETDAPPTPAGQRVLCCDVTGDRVEAALYLREDLRPGQRLDGPALIVEPQTTTLVSADFSARLDKVGNIWLTRNGRGSQ